MRAGDHSIVLNLDSAGIRYSYAALFRIARSDTVLRLDAPLALQCAYESPGPCYVNARRQHEIAGMRVTTSAIGSLFHWAGSGQGVFYPANALNSYASAGIPVIAGTVSGSNVALGTYDQPFLAGRPAPAVTRVGTKFTLTQRSWLVPPATSLVRQSTVRGIEVLEEVIADDAVPGVVMVKLKFRNVTNEVDYFRWASNVTPAALTYTNAYIGFIMDPDVGDAADDWVSYDESLSSVFAYDAAFFESGFLDGAARAPALIALRALRIPNGTHVVLNAWNRVSPTGGSGDWGGGLTTEQTGFNMLTGAQSYAPDHPSAAIGHLPPTLGDARISITAGPLTLAPGQEAEIVFALVLAPPAAGTFTSGTSVAPGDPSDNSRALYRIAEGLRDRLRAAEALLTGSVRN